MPVLRKLTVEEVGRLKTKSVGKRAQIAATYDAYLVGFAPGDAGEVQLDESDKRQVVSARLQAAAARQQLVLTFRRTTGQLLRFEIGVAPAVTHAAEDSILAATIEAPAPKAQELTQSAAVTAPKRRGRPPRAAAAPSAVPIETKHRGRKPRSEN